MTPSVGATPKKKTHVSNAVWHLLELLSLQDAPSFLWNYCESQFLYSKSHVRTLAFFSLGFHPNLTGSYCLNRRNLKPWCSVMRWLSAMTDFWEKKEVPIEWSRIIREKIKLARAKKYVITYRGGLARLGFSALISSLTLYSDLPKKRLT